MSDQPADDPQLRDLIDHLPVGIYRTMPDGRILMANSTLVRLLGYETFEQLSAEPLTKERFGPDNPRRDFQDRLEQNGEVHDWETTWRKRDGSLLRVRESARLVENDQGQVRLYEGAVIDATDRWMASQAQAESELRYRQLIHSLPHGVAIVQHERIVYANKTCAEMLGYENTDLIIGRDSTIGLAPEDHERVVPMLWAALENDGPWPVTFESTSLRKDGTTFPSEVYCGKITYGYERALQLVILDVSDRQAAQREREALLAQLHHSDRLSAVGQLAAGVAHEVNNPLGFLFPHLEELQSGLRALRETPAEDVERIGQELQANADAFTIGLDRIRDVIGELGRFSKVDLVQPEKVGLADLLEACLLLAGKQIERKARIEKVYGETPPVLIKRGPMMQVFLNILLNAAQAVDPQRPQDNRIRLSTRFVAGQACVEINNNGQPIPRKVCERIFEPFFSTKPPGEGTGLGLSVSAAIVKEHGGQIEVESDADQGTTFRIWLPLVLGEGSG